MKEKVPFLYLFILVVPFMMISCSSMYIPSNSGTPLFTQKNEKQVEVSVSTNSARFACGYAFSEKYAVILNGNISYKNFTNRYDLLSENTEIAIDVIPDLFGANVKIGEFANRYIEMGLGRYNLINGKWKLEAFVGYGYGIADDTSWNMNYHANYNLCFAQMNYGIVHRHFDFGSSLRLAGSSYNFKWTDETEYTTIHHRDFNLLHIEPQVFFRFGGKFLKGVVRLGYSYSVAFHSFNNVDLVKGVHDGKLQTTALHFSLGLNYKFGTKKKD
jgi:hypothetical protein